MRKPTANELAVARKVLLPYLPAEQICKALIQSPGDELSEKFSNKDSSAALAVNTFGFFLNQAKSFPQIDCLKDCKWPPEAVAIEQEMRFPWKGGRHPWLDASVTTPKHLIGIESKRYEPFRVQKAAALSPQYWKVDWGEEMNAYVSLRDTLKAGKTRYTHLDAVQLVKHAFGLRTEAKRQGKRAILLYLFAEPRRWASSPDREIGREALSRHADEIADFAEYAKGAEVEFRSCSYQKLLDAMLRSSENGVRKHAATLLDRYDV
jgi:hypothetical protein